MHILVFYIIFVYLFIIGQFFDPEAGPFKAGPICEIMADNGSLCTSVVDSTHSFIPLTACCVL